MKYIHLKTAALLLMVTALIACNDDEPINAAPTATSASLTTQTNTTIMGTVTGSDADGDTLVYTIVTAPMTGSLTFDTSGNFTYQPPLDQTGSDSFEFSVSDGVNDAAIALINITIESLNVDFGEYSRQAFNQLPTDDPLSLKGRTFIQDIENENAYDDLLINN